MLKVYLPTKLCFNMNIVNFFTSALFEHNILNIISIGNATWFNWEKSEVWHSALWQGSHADSTNFIITTMSDETDYLSLKLICYV